MNNQNLACRIFKEQIELVQQLPENERAIVLYEAIMASYNQIENQNDNQIEFQNENAYVSVLSILSRSIINLLSRNIVWKKFSNNYGGKRLGAGAKKKTIPLGEPTVLMNRPPVLQEVVMYANEMNQIAGVGGFKCSPETAEQFWSYYEAQQWRIGNDSRTPILDWQAKLRQWATKDELKKQSVPKHKENDRERKDRENKQKLEELKKRSYECQ